MTLSLELFTLCFCYLMEHKNREWVVNKKTIAVMRSWILNREMKKKLEWFISAQRRICICRNQLDTLEFITKNCQNLQKIDLIRLFANTSVSDKGIMALAKNCSELQEIILWYSNMADNGIIALAKNCPKLQKIDLSGNGNVTDNGIVAWAKNCPKLQKISTCGTSVTSKGRGYLKATIPNIKRWH